MGKTVEIILDSGTTVVVTMLLVAVSEQFLVVVFHLSPYTNFSKQFLAFLNRQSVIKVSIISMLGMGHFLTGINLVLPLVIGLVAVDADIVGVDKVVVVGKFRKNSIIWSSAADERSSPSNFIFPPLHSFRRI